MDATAPTPKVDRHQLEQLIAGLAEGVVLIDPDRSIVWANERALAMHGVDAVAELGTQANEYQEKFILTYRNHHGLKPEQYPIERVLDGQLFSDVVVEVTKPDDPDFFRIHQVRSLVLTDAKGSHESLVLIIQDLSAQFSAQDRFERAFNANPAPALICQLSSLQYIKVNQGFLEMTTYDRDAVLGHSIYELDVLDSADDRDEAIQYLQEWRTISQREAVLKLPERNTEKSVIVAGQPIEIEEEKCMLFTFIDLDPRKKAETSLVQSEERFSKAFRLAPVPMMVCGLPELRILEVNAAFLAGMGYAAEEVAGTSLSDLGLWKAEKHHRSLLNKLGAGDVIRNLEVSLQTISRTTMDCLFSTETVLIQGEECVLCVMQDITERKRSETDLVEAIDAVMKDASWFTQSVMEKLAQVRGGGKRSEVTLGLADLTPREREVLTLICKGNDDESMAATLKLSRNTVRNHIATLYGKIGVNRRSAAVVWGRDRGVVSY
ncbi:CsgBAC operon transcriptional regulatory protein [Dyella sp. AD56]|uniref:PAS domain S-box protein n=1 Tax=Dyella sp. AD56 TaxID=1528744 RepID=UPI000C84832F|nr:PAS domain S-box protein [Dyella sp. AD56]PMQ05778.1 CsgBAC operon transcriptional regulatory protein [Dyella sp. AD56]